MKTTKSNTGYLEWLNAEEMHTKSLEWLSDLRFIKNEQNFFEKLIKSYQFDLINSSHIMASEKIIKQLRSIKKETKKLLASVQSHANKLEIIVDDIEQPLEEEAYRKEHLKLIITVAEFLRKYQQLKMKFFNLIKGILKEKQQKLLV